MKCGPTLMTVSITRPLATNPSAACVKGLKGYLLFSQHYHYLSHIQFGSYFKMFVFFWYDSF